MFKIIRVIFFIVFFNVAYGTNSNDFETIFRNLDESLNQIYPVLIGLCYLLGVFFILKSLFMLKKLGYKTAFMHADSGMIGPAGIMLIGVVLMYTPTFLEIMFLTLYGNSEVTAVAGWSGVSGGSNIANWEDAIVPMIGLIQIIGMCAFIKGWITIMKATGANAQPGNLSKGFMHVFSGILAINITGTIDVINRSLGLA